MPSEIQSPLSKKALWAGWVLTLLPALALLMSGVMKLLKPPDVVKGFTDLGWPDRLALALAIVEIGSTLIYLVPRTAVLGAILLTGYLGGAIATHVRIGDSFVAPLIIGILVWGGLYLRDARLRALVPIRM